MHKFMAALACLTVVAGLAVAHHSPVVYDGKKTVTITGTVTSARFGYPHSRFLIDVRDESGNTERWTLMTEDPRDAKMLGFDDELQAIKVGDTITVVGWPNKIKPREIRGHQLHYDDGRVVMMRRGNYIWTDDLRRIWRLRDGQIDYPDGIASVAADRPAIERISAWLEQGDVVARVAREIEDGHARLVGIRSGGEYEFAGVRDDFLCHIERPEFRLEVDAGRLSDQERGLLGDNADYLNRYNDLLATYWEYDIASCE